MTILLSTDFDAAETAQWLERLRAALPGETIAASRESIEAASIDIALVANPPAGALLGLPKLAWIHSLWAGVDRLLADATIPPGLPIVRMVDPAMTAAMAETALWAVLALHRGFFDYGARQREGLWRQHPQRFAGEVEVAVLGLGEMGREVARRIAEQGYRVTGWSRSPVRLEGIEAAHGPDGLDAVLARAEIVLSLLPLTDATRGLFDARRFAAMRRGASLVNLARGAQVVEADLLEALDAGVLHRAVLDVFAVEPLPAAHPFWAHPKVTVLPHAAAMTDVRSAAAIVAANVRAWRGGTLPGPRVDRARGY
jgi:glyoxylate/hydroxypyruvate reductase A